MLESILEGMQQWFAHLRARMPDAEAQTLFDTYAEEALFGRRLIAPDLEHLPAGSAILEVGAGAMLLSSQLTREGFKVTALEPTGSGFSHFERMRQVVLESAGEGGFEPTLCAIRAEQLDQPDTFDYGFSVNVMEHVDDVGATLERVADSLKAGATYRFTCANYLFPYEPHFNLPTLFSKRLTERVLGPRIFNSRRVTDPVGTWRSLNWITVPQVAGIVRRSGRMQVIFDRSMLVCAFERILSDPLFARRRSPLVCSLITAMVKVRLHKLLSFIPASMQPIIDCRISKTQSRKRP
ncbi:class I SAM-dependent methyltransferase [Pseudomonas japonica]|uniref:class I SAM-dependent methyltransferase n=1 Tax=Pseudomonas japonica TaxID=256466 RepID=UPI0006948DA5|nr:methyltransferase domain-containing protein [Pseudomonas japonica]